MPAGITPDAANALLETWRGTPTYGMVHVGDPGEDGTANPSVGDPSPQRVFFTAAEDGELAVTTGPKYVNTNTDETLTYLSVWNGPSSADDMCLFITELDPPFAWSEGDTYRASVGFTLTPLTTEGGS